jgi:hypothetical protein
MQTVLSIDVDYFVRPKVTAPEPGTRPDDERHRVRELADVDCFLRNRCLIASERPVAGLSVPDHDAAFGAVQRWISTGALKTPFRLVHVDAHADLGLGDAGYAEIVEDILLRHPEDRATNLREFGLGNWLAYAIANQWISEVMFLREPDPGLDCELLACFFCNSPDCSVLQMRPMEEKHYLKINHFNRYEYAGLPTSEPEVKWNQMGEKGFVLDQPPDLVFACLSPEYSPPKAVAIFDLVRTFIREG